MTELSILASNSSNRKTGFWQRQVAQENTAAQTVFDVMFGIIGPVLCFVFDPVVFQSGFFGAPLFAEYQVLVYAFSGLAIIVLGLWLLSGSTFHFSNELMGGFLIWGGIFSATVGIILLPFSAFGALIYGIGLFGLTPFLTAIVYLRNGARAWSAQKKSAPLMMRGASLLLSFVLLFGIPVLVSITIRAYVESSVAEIIKGDSQHAIAAAQGLKPLSYFASSELDQLVNAYLSEPDPARQQLLKSCYQEITGKDIESRARILRD